MKLSLVTRGVPVSATVLLTLALSGCHQEAPAASATPATANLKIETVHAEETSDQIELPGRVESDPARLVHVYAPLSGRLTTLTITPGQDVRKGQPVGTLQSGDVAQARSDFEKARIEALRADSALDRGKLLLVHDVMSQADYQELVAIAAAAHAEQERARQRVHELGFSESGTSDIIPILAPITGTVLDLGTAAGEMQRSLETTNGIATIANLDSVWVTGDLYERDMSRVHLHQPVDILLQAYPGETLHGTVANIGDSLDPSTHAVKVRVILANPGHRLKPAMYASLQVLQPSASRIMIPLTAVLHDGNSTEIYVPADDGKYELREVTIGATHGNQVEVLNGLRDGDRVVTEGAAFLREPSGD